MWQVMWIWAFTEGIQKCVGSKDLAYCLGNLLQTFQTRVPVEPGIANK